MMVRPFALLALLAFSVSPAAELQFGDEAMSVSFDYLEVDMRKDEQHFTGNVRISQGPMSIAADRATAIGASRSDRARWTFEGNVHVRTAEADLRANSATATVVKGVITSAVVKGSPAVFEQRNSTTDKRVLGRAGEIDYDVARAIVRLTKDVWFSYGPNEFRGAVVLYYVTEERVVVNPGGKDQGRVNITVRPNTLSTPADDPAEATEAESSR